MSKLSEALVSVWEQSLRDRRDTVEVDGSAVPVTRTRAKGLLVVEFRFDGHAIEGIEQNPQTSSRWAKMAQEGKRIVQFRSKGRYFANVAEGKLTRYPAWTTLGLPD